MKSLKKSVESFLECNRSLGYKMEHHTHYLRDFVSFMKRRNMFLITNTLALEWAMEVKATPHTWSFRLGVIRRFARYHFLIDRRTEIPSTRLLPIRYRRRHPYLYSNAEISRLLEAAGNPKKPFWGIASHTLYAVLGLTASTGLRRSELINLDVDDVDLGQGILAIKMTKFNKSRMVPVHRTVVRRLREYCRLRDAQPNLKTNAFFVTKQGKRLSRPTINFAFRHASVQAGLRGAKDSHGPRLHDLRHTFAVNTLVGWLRKKADVDSKIPRLSTYLGHVSPQNTYWYFSCAPKLMNLARRRMEDAAKEIV